MSDEQTEFADFFQASWDPCLRAVVAVVDRQVLPMGPRWLRAPSIMAISSLRSRASIDAGPGSSWTGLEDDVASTSRRSRAANRPGRRHAGYSSFRQLRGSAGCSFGVRPSRKLK